MSFFVSKKWIPAIATGAGFYAMWHMYKSENRSRWQQFKYDAVSPSRRAFNMPTFEDIKDDEYRQQQQILKNQTNKRIVNNQSSPGNQQQEKQHLQTLNSIPTRVYSKD